MEWMGEGEVCGKGEGNEGRWNGKAGNEGGEVERGRRRGCIRGARHKMRDEIPPALPELFGGWEAEDGGEEAGA